MPQGNLTFKQKMLFKTMFGEDVPPELLPGYKPQTETERLKEEEEAFLAGALDKYRKGLEMAPAESTGVRHTYGDRAFPTTKPYDPSTTLTDRIAELTLMAEKGNKEAEKGLRNIQKLKSTAKPDKTHTEWGIPALERYVNKTQGLRDILSKMKSGNIEQRTKAFGNSFDEGAIPENSDTESTQKIIHGLINAYEDSSKMAQKSIERGIPLYGKGSFVEETNTIIDELNMQYPPGKYPLAEITDDRTGRKFRSDGKNWISQ